MHLWVEESTSEVGKAVLRVAWEPLFAVEGGKSRQLWEEEWCSFPTELAQRQAEEVLANLCRSLLLELVEPAHSAVLQQLVQEQQQRLVVLADRMMSVLQLW